MGINFKILIPLCYVILLSCQQPVQNDIKNKTELSQPQKEISNQENISSEELEKPVLIAKVSIDSLAQSLVTNLKNGIDIASFFAEDWIFIYHADNRCDGSTDGKIDHLKSLAVDKTIKLTVKNDGDGWACEKTKPKSYDLNFNLKNEVKSWDRLLILNQEKKERNVIYIIGKGESDYLKLHYNEVHLIVKIEYRSEDPG